MPRLAGRLSVRLASSCREPGTSSKSPSQVEVEDVIAYRDDLVKRRRRKARTVNMKLSVVRAYFGYLKAAGDIAVRSKARAIQAGRRLAGHNDDEVVMTFLERDF